MFDLVSSSTILDPLLESLIGDILTDLGWSLPSAFTDHFLGIADIIKLFVILDLPNALHWMSSLDGTVTCSDAYASLSDSPVACT